MAKNAKPAEAWGRWVWRRAEVVGYRRQQDLAAAVGCTRERIVAWLALREPPRQMRKGFDFKLAAALLVSRRVLFTDYASISPEAAPEEYLHPDQSGLPTGDALMSKIARFMTEHELIKIIRAASLLVLSKNDHRRKAFEEILSSNGLWWHVSENRRREEKRKKPRKNKQ